MKRRFLAVMLILVMALTVINLAGGGIVQAESKNFNNVGFISGVVIANELNMRTGPATSNPIMQVLKKGKWVNVLSEIEGWYVIYDPDTDKVGCVVKTYLMDGVTYTSMGGKTTPVPPAPSATPAPAPGATPGGQLSTDEQELLNLINSERAKAGVSALVPDADLMNVGRTKAGDMVQNNYFNHISPTYGSPFDMMRQFGITFKTAGENIAGNQTISGAVAAWMGSAGHKANILNSAYNYTGIGIAQSNKYGISGKPGYVIVQEFIGK